MHQRNGSEDPDPYQHETDPQHCFDVYKKIFRSGLRLNHTKNGFGSKTGSGTVTLFLSYWSKVQKNAVLSSVKKSFFTIWSEINPTETPDLDQE